jgi:redox-sensitive bicupin YhaK (pirin superfamily)
MSVRRALPPPGATDRGGLVLRRPYGTRAGVRDRGLDIGPHPHTELHTVTWLVASEVLHRDSLGSQQVIRAGQVKLMTAGEGVTHSEEATGRYRGQLHGVQLWMAQPDTGPGPRPGGSVGGRTGPAATARRGSLR